MAFEFGLLSNFSLSKKAIRFSLEVYMNSLYIVGFGRVTGRVGELNSQLLTKPSKLFSYKGLMIVTEDDLWDTKPSYKLY